MAGLLKSFLGSGSAPKKAAEPSEDTDFADFAGAPDPSPVAASPSIVSEASTLSQSAIPTDFASIPIANRPYTKWYRVWERVTLDDFKAELYILPFILAVVAIHLFGTRRNKQKAKSWINIHGPILEQEYAMIGFAPQGQRSMSEGTLQPMDVMREKTVTEYATYATGRLNVAFTDIKLTLKKRHNPMGMFGEEAIGLFIESQPAPRERMEASSYIFDGREADLAPLLRAPDAVKADGEKQKSEQFKSTFDGFVFAVVHKEMMKTLRDNRYDLSLTVTKDHQKLPSWATVMSESAEITESLLTPELCKAVEEAGEVLESLIVTDQPLDQPKTVDDAAPRKRTTLSMRIPSTEEQIKATLPLFRYFLRLPDILCAAPRFRAEALRRVRATRDEEIRKIKKTSEDEKAEERRTKAEKEKKEEREKKLRNLSADEQRKALEKERASDMRRGQKKKTTKS
ncbi:MAG: hypothetical protein M1831_001332 [Alyxoria varia]|nr:MAG: hypothetical protein M1831_001332 [Alyxoria varia]